MLYDTAAMRQNVDAMPGQRLICEKSDLQKLLDAVARGQKAERALETMRGAISASLLAVAA